jgi:hypothetical protein
MAATLPERFGAGLGAFGETTIEHHLFLIARNKAAGTTLSLENNGGTLSCAVFYWPPSRFQF